MIKKVIIERIKENGVLPTNQVTLTGTYSINGVTRALKDNDEWIPIDLNKTDNSGKLLDHGISDYSFNASHTTKVYEFEDDEELMNQTDRNKKSACEVFWSEHPLVIVNGKAHKNSASTAMFNIVDLKDESLEKVDYFKKGLEAANKVVAMTLAEKRDVCYFYGISPDGKTTGEITLLLANFKDGLCTTPGAVDEFMYVWCTEDNTDRDMIVTLKKALALNIIANRVIDGRSNYYLGQELIGTSENDLLSYSKTNRTVYDEFVSRKVKEEDTFVDDTKPKVKKEEMSKEDFQALKNEAKELKADGFLPKKYNYWFDKPAALLAKVEAARIKKSESTSQLQE